MVKKKKQTIKPIEGAFKSKGILSNGIMSESQWKAGAEDADRRVWCLANALGATSGAEQMIATTILSYMKKWGYGGAQTDTFVRCLKRYRFVQEELFNAMTQCYKDKTLQLITVGNLQSIFEDLIGMTVGITVEGDYCSCPCDVALIPKTLTPSLKAMPTAGQIQWLGDMTKKAVAEGEEYMEHNKIEKYKPEFEIQGDKIINKSK